MDNFRDNMQPGDERNAAADRREAFYNGQQANRNNTPPNNVYQNSQMNDRQSYLYQPGYAKNDSSIYNYGQNDYQYNNYNQNGYGQYDYRQENTQTSGLAIASLILGIVSILLCWVVPLAMPASIVGIILAVIALSKKHSRGMSIAGMITSIVGGILAILIVAFIFFAFSAMDSFESYSSDDEPYFSPYPYAEEEEGIPFDEFEDFFDNLQ